MLKYIQTQKFGVNFASNTEWKDTSFFQNTLYIRSRKWLQIHVNNKGGKEKENENENRVVPMNGRFKILYGQSVLASQGILMTYECKYVRAFASVRLMLDDDVWQSDVSI